MSSGWLVPSCACVPWRYIEAILNLSIYNSAQSGIFLESNQVLTTENARIVAAD